MVITKQISIASIFMALSPFLLSCVPDGASSASQHQPPTANAVEYRILAVEDTSFPGRVRKSVHIIAPDATEIGARAETALKAAVDLQKKWDADAVGVFLEISANLRGHGFVLAIANYSPDGGGWNGNSPFRNITWQGEASAIVLSDNEVRIGEMWYERRDRFQVDDGFGGRETDENAVKSDIANELGIAPDNVSLLPLMEVISSREQYFVVK
jgi:hypothetical protein